jgi:hypothetical protein
MTLPPRMANRLGLPGGVEGLEGGPLLLHRLRQAQAWPGVAAVQPHGADVPAGWALESHPTGYDLGGARRGAVWLRVTRQGAVPGAAFGYWVSTRSTEGMPMCTSASSGLTPRLA